MRTRSNRFWFAIALAMIFIQATVLHINGRPLFCLCGVIRFWVGSISSSETSQQLTDWYTFTHIVHGILLYGLLWLARKRLPFGARLVIAIAFESSWEMIENSRFIIDRYRQSALANGYVGDSILNSLSDTASMIAGFFLARLSPKWFAITWAVGSEVLLGYFIRDNLTLNLLQLIYPVAAVSTWQAGG